MARDPRLRILQRLSAQAELMNTPLDGAFDKPGLLQHLQMLGDRRLGRAKLAAEFAGASGLASRKRMNH